MEWSKYQNAIFDWIGKGNNHLMVNAVAGSGKTTTTVEGFKYAEGQTLFLAFNKHIANTLADRLPDGSAKTYHATGFQMCRESISGVQFDQYKVDKLLAEENILNKENFKFLYYPVKRLVSLLKANVLEPTDENMQDIIYHHNIDFGEYNNISMTAARKVMQRSLELDHTIDFDDMVWFPVVKPEIHPQTKYDFIAVDEVQDTNKVQMELALKLVNGHESRIMGVGDPYQCLVKGTKILCSSQKLSEKPYYKNIEDIEIGDMLVGYSSRRSHFTGSTTQGRLVTNVHRQVHNGQIIKFSAGNSTNTCTPNHKWLAKIPKKNKDKYVLYLMQSGKNVRIGIVKAFVQAGFGLSVRSRQEQAEKSWILDVFDTKTEATKAEVFTQTRFGLSGLVFKNRGNSFMNQDDIDDVYSCFEKWRMALRMLDCLSHYNRLYEHPVWTNKGDNYHIGAKSFIIEACNLIPNFMYVKTYSGKIKDSTWENISHLDVSTKTTDVYGITVEPGEDGRRLYVANNTVSHNSIYGFRGADVDAMPNLQKRLNAKTLPLSVSYRAPLAIVDLVNQEFPEIAFEPSPNAIDGNISTVSYGSFLAGVKPGDMVLCRTNAPLVPPVFSLIRSGIKAQIVGRDIGKSLKSLVKKMKDDNLLTMLVKLQEYMEYEVYKLQVRDRHMQAQSLEDKCETIFALSDGCSTITDLYGRIDSVFDDNVQGIAFSTVHRAKGLEANRVYILEPELMPHPAAKADWERLQEDNIRYVAFTRALQDLVFVRTERI